MLKPSLLSQTVSLLSISFVAFSAHAASCGGVGTALVVNGAANSCSADDANYKSILVQANAEVTEDTAVTVTPDTALRYTGIRVESGGKYIFGSTNGVNTLDITASQNGTTYGESYALFSTGQNSLVDITADKVNLTSVTSNTGGAFTFGIRANDNGKLLIEADEVNVDMTKTTTNNASGVAISANNGGQLEIKGKNGGMSLTTIVIEGKDSPYGLGSTTNSNRNTLLKLDLVDITVTGKSTVFSPSNYNVGAYAEGTGAKLEFLGGKIVTNATDSLSYAGSAIRSRDHSVVNVVGYDTSLTPNYVGLEISTANMDARAIRATGGSEVFINKDAQSANFVTKITTTGTISDGLNAGRLQHNGEYASVRAGSKIVVYGTTEIETQANNSYGLRLIGDGSSIELLKVAGQTARSTIHSNSTAIRYGFANGYNQDDSNNVVTGGQSIIIESADITSDGASGSWARNNTGTNILSDTNGNNTWTTGNLIQVGDHQGDVGVQGEGGYAITVADVVKDGVLTLRDSTATAATGKDLLNVTYGGGTTLLTDKISSSFTLNADSSVLKGSVFTDTTLDKDGNASKSALNLTNNTEWYIERNSNASFLNVQTSNVYLNTASNWASTATGNFGNELTVNELMGNGHFFFNTDIVAQQTDKLIVADTNQAYGNHVVTVKNDASQATNGTEVIDIIETQGGSANFSLYQGKSVELGQWEYGLRKTVDSVTGQQNGNWQLYATPRRSSTAQAFNTFVNTNYMLTYIDIQTLLQRIGELRDTEGDGDFWMRGFAGKLNTFSSSAFDGYDMHYRGTQAGIDKLIKTTSQGRLYVGGMVGYIDADQDFRKGSGSAKNYHLGIYTTYITNDDLYFDGVVKYAKLKNSFNVKDSQGAGVTGTGNTNAISLSGEVGKRFYINEGKQGLYIEPQAQLVYTYNGSDSTRASNDLKVKFNNYDSLIGRGSAVIGYQVANTANPINVYFKTGYVREFKGKVAYKVNDAKETTSFRGGWFENGVGISATINKNHNVYGEVSYSNGNRFDKQQLNVGYRYAF